MVFCHHRKAGLTSLYILEELMQDLIDRLQAANNLTQQLLVHL